MPQPNFLESKDTFVPRHIGPTESDIQEMLATLSLPSLEALVEATVPYDIRLKGALAIPSSRGEQDVLDELQLPSTTDLIAVSADTDSADGQNDAENPLLAALGFDPVGLDALVARTGIAPAQLQVQLLELELDNLVARLPGGLFQRLAAA